MGQMTPSTTSSLFVQCAPLVITLREMRAAGNMRKVISARKCSKFLRRVSWAIITYIRYPESREDLLQCSYKAVCSCFFISGYLVHDKKYISMDVSFVRPPCPAVVDDGGADIIISLSFVVLTQFLCTCWKMGNTHFHYHLSFILETHHFLRMQKGLSTVYWQYTGVFVEHVLR